MGSMTSKRSGAGGKPYINEIEICIKWLNKNNSPFIETVVFNLAVGVLDNLLYAVGGTILEFVVFRIYIYISILKRKNSWNICRS